MYWRWIISIILGLCWLLVVCSNLQWLWIKFKSKDRENNTSPVALAGALFAIGALAACPWNNPRKWYLLVPALILDAGSGLLIVLGLAAFLVESLGILQKRVAGASWIIKFGGGFLVWFILVGGTLSEAAWRQYALGVVVVAYWPILLAWFWRLSKFPSQEKNPK